MATEFFVPQLGQTVEEVTLVKWLVKDGDKVDFGQEVMEVETDKAVFPVEANGKGVIHLGPYKEGDVIPVLTVVAIIGSAEDHFEARAAAGKSKSAAPAVEESPAAQTRAAIAPSTTPAQQQKRFASPRARKLAAKEGLDLSLVTPSGGGGVRVKERDVIAHLQQVPKATPLAQRAAQEAGINLQGVLGSGPGGRITKNDIARALEARPAAPSTAALPEDEVSERIPLKGVRAVIAERMAMSVHTTAGVTLITEVDASEFVELREGLKSSLGERWGFSPAYNDLLAKIVASALRKFPYMNARLAGDAIEHLAQVNIGIAVDTERGLMVPVIRDADRKSLRVFGSEFRQLVERARNGRSLPEDLSGGTFTITNLGVYEIDAFTPVINLPELAILGVGRIHPKPVVRNNAVAIRQMLTLSLVFDHRLVDGAPAARFLQYIKQVIEEPYLLLFE